MAIPFLLIPVLTKYLSPSDYGRIRLVNVYVVALIPLLTLCSSSLFSVDFFKRHSSRLSSLMTTSLVIPLPQIVLAYLIIFSFGESLSTYFQIDYTIALFIPLLVYFTFLYDYFLQVLIAQKEAKKYMFYTITRVLVESILTILLVVVIYMGWHGRIYSWILILIILSVVALVYFYKNKWLIQKPLLYEVKLILIYSLPIVFHQLGKFVINWSDTLFIAKLVNISETGIYSVGYQIGSLVSVFGGIFLNIYSPFLFERLTSLSLKNKFQIVYVSYIFILLTALLVLFLTLLSPFIFSFFFDERYYNGHIYVFWTAFAYFFWCCYLMLTGVIFFYKKTRLLVIISVVNVICNLSFNYIFISSYGTMGASYATLLSFFITFLITGFFSGRILSLPWKKIRIIVNGHKLFLSTK